MQIPTQLKNYTESILKRKSFLLLALGAIIVAASIALLILLHPPKGSADWAGWVSGIGTVLAVAVTAWVGLLPMREERRRQERLAADFRDSVRQAAAYALDQIVEVRRAMGTQMFVNVYNAVAYVQRAGGGRALRRLVDEPLTRWPSPKAYIYADRLCDAVLKLERYGLEGAAARPEFKAEIGHYGALAWDAGEELFQEMSWQYDFQAGRETAEALADAILGRMTRKKSPKRKRENSGGAGPETQ